MRRTEVHKADLVLSHHPANGVCDGAASPLLTHLRDAALAEHATREARSGKRACASVDGSGTRRSWRWRGPAPARRRARTCSGQFLCQLAPSLFRPFLAHFCPFFPIFSPFAPSCPQDSGNRHQDPEKRSVTVEKRRAKNPKLTLIFLGVGTAASGSPAA